MDSIENRESERVYSIQHHSEVRSITLEELFSAIRRWKWLLVFLVLVAVALSFFALNRATPRYTAEALIMLDARQTNVIDVEEVVTNLPVDTRTIASELEILRSRGLLRQLVDKLELHKDPEFNSDLAPDDWKSIFVTKIKSWLPIEFSIDEDSSENSINDITEATKGRVWVRQKGDSWLIGVYSSSDSPSKAALIANTLSELYIFRSLNSKMAATQQATNVLNKRIVELRSKVEESEQAVEQYRVQSGLLGTRGETLISQQIEELNMQLTLAKSETNDASVRLGQIRALTASGQRLEAIGEVLESTLIRNLRQQEVELLTRRAELSNEYGDRHPVMINLRAELNDLRNLIAGEVDKIVGGIENEERVARAREASLQQRLDELKDQIANANTAEVELRALEREAEANRNLLNTFLSRAKETSYQEDIDIQKPDARIVSRAVDSKEPSYPKKKLVLTLAALGSTVFGLLLIFFIERFDRGLYSGEQIEKLLGVSALGLVPKLSGSSRSNDDADRHIADYVLAQPLSLFTESVRGVTSSILLSNRQSRSKTVLVTSALAEEGKSSTTIALGRVLARMGYKTLLLDTDVRLPSFHNVFRVSRSPGLTELLMGQAQLSDVLKRDKSSGADFICSGVLNDQRPDIVASIDDKLKELGTRYDVILIDSAPVLAVSDAKFLSAKVDMTLVVVRWANTPAAAVRTAIKQINASGGHVIGAVLSMVDLRKLAQYQYEDSYTGQAQKYYTKLPTERIVTDPKLSST